MNDQSMPESTAEDGLAPGGRSWVFFLGAGLQAAFWFTLTLLMILAHTVGSEVTDFRYVGF